MNANKLVQIHTEDGLYLQGYYIPTSDKKRTVLHIHGFEGNFYENNFVHVLANSLESNGIGFLSVNTRGNGKITDFNTVEGTIKTIGARYELLEEAHKDITAWIDFLISEGYQEIVLQGHSLGTVKVVRYLTEGKHHNKIAKLILLAPFDKKGYLIANNKPKLEDLLIKAEKVIEKGNGADLISGEFGDGDMSYKTFVSWYKQDDLGRMYEFCSKDYEFPVLKAIKVPTKIIVGSVDEYFYPTNTDNFEEAMEILLNKIPISVGKIIPDTPHSFKPHEDIMANEVISFIKEGN